MIDNSLNDEILATYVGLPGIKSFRPGQAEATRKLISLIDESGSEFVAELEVPTSGGKTLILSTVGNYEGYAKGCPVTYCTTQRTLVAQIHESGLLDPGGDAVPSLMGRANYDCAYVDGVNCSECAYSKKEKDCPERSQCPYLMARRAFFSSRFGVTTVAYALANPRVKERPLLLVDEADQLERELLNLATVPLPSSIIANERIDLDGFIRWKKDLEKDRAREMSRLEAVRDLLEGMSSQENPSQREENNARMLLKSATGNIRGIDRKLQQADIIGLYLKKNEPYLIESNIFKPIMAKVFFGSWSKGMKLVMASATPTSSLLCTDFSKVNMPHPIPVDRRKIIYAPVCGMGRNSRTDGSVKAMAERIIELHQAEATGRHTLVHCHSKALTSEFYQVMQHDPRVMMKESGPAGDMTLDEWRRSQDKILLSYGMTRGLDLKGPQFPLNIQCKVPYPDLGSKAIRIRNELDGWHWYNLQTAISIMQAAGRTTRDASDYSRTYILDSNFGSFLGNNRDLFSVWFLEALERVNGQSMKEPSIPLFVRRARMDNREQYSLDLGKTVA
jgi:Rad3-related DNA helicase